MGLSKILNCNSLHLFCAASIGLLIAIKLLSLSLSLWSDSILPSLLMNADGRELIRPLGYALTSQI